MAYWKLSLRMEDIPVIKRHNGGALKVEPLFCTRRRKKNPPFFIQHNALNSYPRFDAYIVLIERNWQSKKQ